MMHLVQICSTRTFLDSWLRVTPPSGGTESPSAGGASVWTVQTIAARRCQHRRPRHQHKEDWEPSAVQPQLQFSLLLHGGNRSEFLDINSTYESQNLNYIWRSIWTWSLLTRFSTEMYKFQHWTDGNESEYNHTENKSSGSLDVRCLAVSSEIFPHCASFY